MKHLILMMMVSFESSFAHGADDVLRLKVGFVKKLSCEGRLFVSAVGNDRLVHLEALPKELGCAVILKPTGKNGTTNIVLETSSGSIERVITIEGGM